MSDIFEVGIVGSGNIADSHYGALLGDENVRILGVCDVDRERREECALACWDAVGRHTRQEVADALLRLLREEEERGTSTHHHHEEANI